MVNLEFSRFRIDEEFACIIKTMNVRPQCDTVSRYFVAVICCGYDMRCIERLHRPFAGDDALFVKGYDLRPELFVSYLLMRPPPISFFNQFSPLPPRAFNFRRSFRFPLRFPGVFILLKNQYVSPPSEIILVVFWKQMLIIFLSITDVILHDMLILSYVGSNLILYPPTSTKLLRDDDGTSSGLLTSMSIYSRPPQSLHLLLSTHTGIGSCSVKMAVPGGSLTEDTNMVKRHVRCS